MFLYGLILPILVCLLVAGPEGTYDFSLMARSELPSSPTTSPGRGSNGSCHQQQQQYPQHLQQPRNMSPQHPHHHQMTYHNMFTPSRDPGTMWRCRSCGKEVTNRWHHYHSHTAQRSMCPYCPATYSRIDTLRSHLRTKHADRLIKHETC